MTNDHQQQSTRANLSTVIENLVKKERGITSATTTINLATGYTVAKKGHPIRPFQMITPAAAALNNQPMYKSEREKKSVVQCWKVKQWMVSIIEALSLLLLLLLSFEELLPKQIKVCVCVIGVVVGVCVSVLDKSKNHSRSDYRTLIDRSCVLWLHWSPSAAAKNARRKKNHSQW